MFRLIAKLPKKHLVRRNCQPLQIIPFRGYATPEPICPPPKPKKPASTGTAYTLGALALVGVATIGYARYDPEFRKWLGENVPGSDSFFILIFQEGDGEGKGAIEWIGEKYESVTKSVTEVAGVTKKKDIEGEHKEYTPPRPIFPALVKEEKEEKFSEIRVMKEDAQNVEIVKEKPKKPEEILSPTHPKNMADLEHQICDAATSAIHSYNQALTALKNYNQEIECIVETSVDRLDQTIWKSLKTKTDEKNELLGKADKCANEAVEKLRKLETLLKDKSFMGNDAMKATACRSMERYLEDIKKAKMAVDDERKMADVTEKYWQKVQTARGHFMEELEILFPEFDIARKKLSLSQADFDLFILHAFANVLFYQKELQKVETVGKARLKNALDHVKKGDPNFNVVDIHIQEEIESEKRKLAVEYQKKCLALRQESERELRHRLKCQAEAHQDHLCDALNTREQELEREFNKKLDDELAKEQLKYKTQLAGMVGRMKGMRNAITERVEADKIAQKSQVLWSACQALHRAVKTSKPGVAWTEQVKPLKHEIVAIKDAASDGDELVKVVLKAIPEEAVTRGVFPEDAIRERFLKVERVARRVALVPEEGGRLPLYILSFIQSMLLVQASNPIPQSELADEKTDFSKLDTYDILQRARYWLDRGNYAQTLRYMNLLKGASRSVATEWMNETRILLETQQAAETLMAHAVAGGLTQI